MLDSLGWLELGLISLVCLPFVLMVWALIDCVRREFAGPNEKLIWVIIILLAYYAGPLIYFAMGRPRGTPGIPPSA